MSQIAEAWPELLGRLIKGETLSRLEAESAMTEVLEGRATSAQLAALLSLMRSRRETADEMSGFALAMRNASLQIPLVDGLRMRAIDTCGTGGDKAHTINVSTTAAFVVAAAGVPVCKHGNRAASSATGSADLLEYLGVEIELSPEAVAACVEQVGVGFAMAPRFHPAMRHAGPTRRELGVATAFNFLGPIANPGRIVRQVIGVSDPSMASLVLEAARVSGAEHVMVVFGHDGLDELTTTTTSTVTELRNGESITYEVDPQRLGFRAATHEQLVGGAVGHNAERTHRILEGERGAQADLVCLNAAAGLVVGGVAETLAEGIEVARKVLDDGGGANVLDEFVALSQSLANT